MPGRPCTHSLFGVSKLAGDVMTQEYGRYFGIKTGVFRGGCLTGPYHSGVAAARVPLLPGQGRPARRNIHDHRLQGEAGPRPDPQRGRDPGVWAFYRDPRPGEVYNLGGGRGNAASILETPRPDRPAERPADLNTTYDQTPRVGDHICYITDLAKFRAHYPGWDLTRSLDSIVEEVFNAARPMA